MVDGARMVSPGLLQHARLAAGLHPRPVIAALGFHLGPDVQRRAIRGGYDQDAEDALLESVDWTKDGYRLFDISVFAGSSKEGWFAPFTESNALFMPSELWSELGGYDERFESLGGGFVNVDTFARACALPDAQLIALLGEGTFHQIHGGVATNSPTLRRQEFAEEYRTLTGRELEPPPVAPLYVGTVSPHVKKSFGKPRARRRGEGPPVERRYTRLLTRSLLNLDGIEARRVRRAVQSRKRGLPLDDREPGFAKSGASLALLARIDRCISTVLTERVPGDLVQAGVGRGGSGVLMAGVLAAHGDTNRSVWLADPYEEPDDEERVRGYFERLDLLDERVRMLPGSPDQTLAEAPIESVAVLLLGSRGVAALEAVYDRIPRGGFVIVGRYGVDPEAREAVDAFRASRSLSDELERIDDTAVLWRKRGGA